MPAVTSVCCRWHPPNSAGPARSRRPRITATSSACATATTNAFPPRWSWAVRCSCAITSPFSGEIKIARKHTRFIERDLPALIAQGTGQLAERWHQQDARFAAYKQTELGSHEAHDLIIRALDRGAFTPQQLPAVLTQWRTPNHPEFAESRTVWRLFNAVTESIKGSLWALPLRTQALHGLLDDHVCFVGRN